MRRYRLRRLREQKPPPRLFRPNDRRNGVWNCSEPKAAPASQCRSTCWASVAVPEDKMPAELRNKDLVAWELDNSLPSSPAGTAVAVSCTSVGTRRVAVLPLPCGRKKHGCRGLGALGTLFLSWTDTSVSVKGLFLFGGRLAMQAIVDGMRAVWLHAMNLNKESENVPVTACAWSTLCFINKRYLVCGLENLQARIKFSRLKAERWCGWRGHNTSSVFTDKNGNRCFVRQSNDGNRKLNLTNVDMNDQRSRRTLFLPRGVLQSCFSQLPSIFRSVERCGRASYFVVEELCPTRVAERTVKSSLRLPVYQNDFLMRSREACSNKSSSSCRNKHQLIVWRWMRYRCSKNVCHSAYALWFSEAPKVRG